PVPNTQFYAERVQPEKGPPALFAWKPTDRHNPAAWSPVTATDPAWGKPDAEGAQKVEAIIAGVRQELTFPSELQRQLALRTLADWVVRPRIVKVSGVAQAVPMGAGRKQYQVLVDPLKIDERGVTLQDIEAALRANNVNFTGGFAIQSGMEKPIRVIG